MTGCPRPAAAPVAPQQAAGPAGISGPCGCVGAVTDQRTAQQELGRRIDHAQHILLDGLQRRRVSGFGAGVRTGTPRQGPQELAVKRLRLGAEGLEFLGMGTE